MEYSIAFCYISLQEKSWEGALNKRWELLQPYIDLMRQFVSDETKIVFNTTWAYSSFHYNSESALVKYFDNDQMKMYTMIQESAKKNVATNEDIEFLIDGGTAIQNARSSFLTDQRINRDYTHLSYTFGRFVAGLNLIKTISGVDISHISWAPEGVTEIEKQIAIEAVENTQINPFSVTQSVYVEE